MKTAALPSLRVSPQLREDAENVLLDGESLSQFIETAVREQVVLRKAQSDFWARDRARQTGQYIAADDVLNKLHVRLQLLKARAAERV